jgi:glycosyltransferase involved in cell wall biosynthesis
MSSLAAVPSQASTDSVSVVVTTFNHERFIGPALESVLAQSEPPVEVIVIDDGSTDRTAEVLAGFGDRVQVVTQANQGVAASRNAGVRLASGNFIALMDGDDLWAPAKLGVQVASARANPASGMIIVDGIEESDGGVIRPSLYFADLADAIERRDGPVVTGRFYRELLRGSFIGTTSQVMIPARVLADVGPSDTQFRAASDYDLYLRIASRYDLTFVKERLVTWRYTGTSASGPRFHRFLWGEEEAMVLDKQAREGPPEEREYIRREAGWRYFRVAQRTYFYGRQTDRGWARRQLLGILRRHPSLRTAALWIGLWCPDRLVHVFGSGVRAALPDPVREEPPAERS